MTSFRCWLTLLPILWSSAVLGAEPPAKVPEVPVVQPEVREVAEYAEFVGRTEGAQRVEVRARVSGFLNKSAFQDGDDVKAGDLLFELDPRVPRAALDRATAALGQAEAQLKLAETTQKRTAALFERKAASQEELDQARFNLIEAKARHDVARANREIAQLDLDSTQIRAPIAGRAGRCLVDVGNLVQAEKTLLAVLVAVDPLSVLFDVDEVTLLRLHRAFKDVKGLPVQVGLGVGGELAHTGKVDFLDNQLNAEAGTLRLRAILPNKDGTRLPGMFARVRMPLGKPEKTLMLPTRALQTEEGETFVLIVNARDEIERRRVVPGQTHEGKRAIRSGLKSDDRVAIGRLGGLRPGMAVKPVLQPIGEPKPEPEPRPAPRREPPGASRPSLGPGISVHAAYPGANAEVVSETVRAPIEQQVSGMEKVRHLRSRCTSDGGYRLHVSFAPGEDLDLAQVLVSNRVSLAIPQLPDVVKTSSITHTKGGPGVLAIVCLSAPGGRFNAVALTRYARLEVKDPLARIAGVSTVMLQGMADDRLRIQIDPVRLTAFNLNAGDVHAAVDRFKDELRFDRTKLEEIALKSTEGRIIRLRDVARIDWGEDLPVERATFDGKPVLVLAVGASDRVKPAAITAELNKALTRIRARLPEDMELEMAFDFTPNWEAAKAPEHLLLDLDLPVGISDPRAAALRERSDAAVRAIAGVEHVLSLSRNPFAAFEEEPCLLVRLKPNADRAAIIQKVRASLKEEHEMVVRIRDLAAPGSFPPCGYPIDFALSGSKQSQVRAWARELGVRLDREKDAADVHVSRASVPQPQRSVEIDRDAASQRGVALADIAITLRALAGDHLQRDTGPSDSIHFRIEPTPELRAEDLRRLKVRNAKGEMVPLSALARIRVVEAPACLDFLDSRPMVQITANPAANVDVGKLRKLCEGHAEDARKHLNLPKEYRLTWLQEPSVSKSPK